jgi:hypothetical protein
MTLCPLSKFKNTFGEIGQGVHSFKILNTSMVDYILTILLAFFLSYITKIPLVIMTIILFVLAIIFHILFGVKTTTVNWLGIKC